MRQKIWRLRRNAGSTSTQLSILTPLNLSSGSTASQHLLCKILFLLSNTAFVVVLHLTKKEWRMHSPITGQTHYPQTSFSVGCLNDIIPKKLHQNFDASTGHQVNLLKGLGFFHTPTLPACHKGLHDHLRSVMSMHFWRLFSLFWIFLHFWVNWTIEKSPILKK